ncbi:DUF4276 family protein [Myroides sp. WP-1]|uniref:DUF4276 family protein n=1 Tax=Myroides sp. WP-1 TaxID=2759944 RepID=UPI0015FD0FB5|nr:DUF4276 family protein [Myroides sp. WP-1]MBB1139710.1 DUF4276 family protein [Myroides sp. WP-1]
MKRLIVICEGQTEQEFCVKLLAPYLANKNIYIQNPLIKRSGGGIVSWLILKQEIQKYLRSDSSAFVTTFIDLYGITNTHQFPRWEESKGMQQVKNRVVDIENAMYGEINNHRFIPNIVVHEFETILFSDLSAIVDQIDERDLKLNELNQILLQYEDIELINDRPLNAPSKRLENCITGYDKIVYGNILAESIGLEKIRTKCAKFNEWVSKLEYIT